MTLSPTTLNGLRAFNHRNYRLFFIGQAISLIGTWMQQVAQSWLVLTLTHDPIWLGVIVAAQFLPVLVFGLFAGVIADSWPKRRLLLITQVTKMILAFIVFVLVVTGSIQVWMLVLIALALGVANAVDMPVRQSFGIEMVGREDLINAVALNSAMFNGARVIGPEPAVECSRAFLAATFSGEPRHVRRLGKVLAIERAAMGTDPG